MYRRNLAASWAAQANELAADECIDDIFAGGDGWAKTPPADHEPEKKSAGDRHRDTSGGTIKPGKSMASYVVDTKASLKMPTSSGLDEPHDDVLAGRQRRMQKDEVNEIHAREDLRSWTIRRHA